MKYDTVSSTLARIYTTDLNIRGMLKTLERIMDKKSYKNLYERYIILAKDIPKDEILSEGEIKYESFGTDLKYGELDALLRKFEKELDIYRDYKRLSDLNKEIRDLSSEVFQEDFLVEDFIEKNKKLVDLFIIVKNNKTIHQFTDLMKKSSERIFRSLKILSLLNCSDLFEYINDTGSLLLKEMLGSLIRDSVDIFKFVGELDDDYLNMETISECALLDSKLMSKKDKILNCSSKQNEFLEWKKKRLEHLEEYISQLEESIKFEDAEMEKLKSDRGFLKFKRALLRSIVIPAIVLPLSCFYLGFSRGSSDTKDGSSENAIDADDELLMDSSSYVAEVTICYPWEKITPEDYMRKCTVYDYSFESDSEDFSLSLEDIDYERLVKKYSYNEVCDEVSDERYLTENQMYIAGVPQKISDKEPTGGLDLSALASFAGGAWLTWFEFDHLSAGKKAYKKLNKELNENKKSLQKCLKSREFNYNDLRVAENEMNQLVLKKKM